MQRFLSSIFPDYLNFQRTLVHEDNRSFVSARMKSETGRQYENNVHDQKDYGMYKSSCYFF